MKIIFTDTSQEYLERQVMYRIILESVHERIGCAYRNLSDVIASCIALLTSIEESQLFQSG